MIYQIISDRVVRRLSDGACIPNDPANADFFEFQKWLAAGNVPLPADPAPVYVPEPTVKDLIAVLKQSDSQIEAKLAAQMATKQ